MSPGDRLLATTDPLANPSTLAGMDTPLSRPPAWRRYAPYGIAGLWVLVGGLWLLAHSGGHTYRVPIDELTFGEVTKGPFEDFIAVRSTAAPFTTRYLTAEQGGSVKQVLVEDGAEVKAGQPLIVLTNATLQLQVASREVDTAGQINALENTKLRDATTASGEAAKAVRATQLRQLQDTLIRLEQSSATAAASLDALAIRAPTDGQLTALTAEVGQSKAQGAVLGQVDSLDRFKLTAPVDEFYLGRIVRGQAAPALMLPNGPFYQETGAIGFSSWRRTVDTRLAVPFGSVAAIPNTSRSSTA
jgi:HlyD family secretion protein